MSAKKPTARRRSRLFAAPSKPLLLEEPAE